MKRLLFIAVSLLAVTTLHAQQAVSVPLDNYSGLKPMGMEQVESKYFCCAKCDFVAKRQQDCPVHSIPLVHVGDYYCPSCGKHASSNRGTCPEHAQVEKVRMNMKYVVAQPPAEEKNRTTK
jgi:hypothetical protein